MNGTDGSTVFGVKFSVGTPTQIILLLLFFALVILLFGLIKYYRSQQARKFNDQQLFLFKMKRLGLSNFQIKIINNMVGILRLSNPTQLLTYSQFFESAVAKFLEFLREGNEAEDSLAAICKDITIIYEKLYHPANFKRPLESMSNIEKNQLLYFVTEKKEIFLGKIAEDVNEKGIILRLFRNPRRLQSLTGENPVKVFLWRSGDAEYSFITNTKKLENKLLTIEIPEEFSREREVRHPYCDLIVPASVLNADPGPAEEAEEISGTLYKINDFEVVVRVTEKLDYRHLYFIKFELMEFQFEIISKIIANKTIEEGNILYYTLKFENMSAPARDVLKNYMYEHL
ncbi:MAG: hypothetical protein GY754_41795 [bacterium]|nr:hypothetical protein [bacterium]